MKIQGVHVRAKRVPYPREAGFTLVQLLMVLMLLSIIGFIGVPHLANLKSSFDRYNTRSFLVEDLKRAQAETITEGCRGILAIAQGGGSYIYGCDYLAYDDSDSPQPDQVRFTRLLPEGLFLGATGPVIFDSRGQSVDKDGIVSNSTLVLSDGRTGTNIAFASGTLLGTGVFSYD